MSICPENSIVYSLRQRVNNLYSNLPWPSQIKQVAFITQVVGGKGDISSSAKVIELVQNIAPHIRITWYLTNDVYGLGDFSELFDAVHFLKNCPRPQKIRLKRWDPQHCKAELLIFGPPHMFFEEPVINNLPKIPTLHFSDYGDCFIEQPQLDKVKRERDHPSYETVYRCLLAAHETEAMVFTGVIEGTGIFLDRKRLQAERGLHHLLELEDTSLKEAILEKDTEFSMNFGYAYNLHSWEKFIDVITIDEQKRDLVLVCGTSRWQNFFSILNATKLSKIKERGIGKVLAKNKGQVGWTPFLEEQEGRTFRILVWPSISPDDFRRLQLASDRLLATGDNSAAEAWAARPPRLYLYEDIGFKNDFLEQQIRVAKKVAPLLGEILCLFSSVIRFEEIEISILTKLLQKDSLEEDVSKFCQYIIHNFSLEPIFKGAILRAAWHAANPNLMEEEVDATRQIWETQMLVLFHQAHPIEETITLRALDAIGKRLPINLL